MPLSAPAAFTSSMLSIVFRVMIRISVKLGILAAADWVHIGVEDQLEGVVGLVWRKAIYNIGTKG